MYLWDLLSLECSPITQLWLSIFPHLHVHDVWFDCSLFQSRIVRHFPAKFIWGGPRGVNNMILKNEVVTNHFPKARYFASKVNTDHLNLIVKFIKYQNHVISLDGNLNVRSQGSLYKLSIRLTDHQSCFLQCVQSHWAKNYLWKMSYTSALKQSWSIERIDSLNYGTVCFFISVMTLFVSVHLLCQ